jgi:hypothetical protein
VSNPENQKRKFIVECKVTVELELTNDDVRKYIGDSDGVGPLTDPTDTLYETCAEGLAEIAVMARSHRHGANVMGIFDSIEVKEKQ